MLEFLEGLSRPEATILTFGHAGDGNLHVNLLLTQATSGDEALIHDIVTQIMERCLELGGTISGEHGIGLAKRDFLPLEHGHRVLGLERAVKELFDPKGIMNPGKMFKPGRSG
jgi:FAD/FMN-containing dehydrogenase